MSVQKICLTVIIFIISTLAIGCCTEKYCLGLDDLQEIWLADFAAEEIDSIALEIYDANTNFTQRVDSVFSNGENGKISMPQRVSLSHNYKVTLLSTGETYQITDMAIKKEQCNCPGDHYNALNRYSVNGNQVVSATLTIYKQ